MTEAMLLKPDLYGSAEAGETGGPVLRGGECACGAVFFPMQTYGCEVCGRDGAALRPRDIGGEGALIAAAVVHMHHARPGPAGAPVRQAPFVIGSVALDAGPVVRTLLTVDAAPVPGTRMVATLIEVEIVGGASPMLDLRFAPAD